MKTKAISLAALLILATTGCGDSGDDTSCTVVDNGDGTWTFTCDDGTQGTYGGDESCSVTDHGDGTTTIACDDGTSATVGGDTSCSVNDNGDGTTTVTCDDGTAATMGGGQVRTVRGTINPGETLSLTHDFGTVVALAQYEEEDTLFDIREYPWSHSPVTYGPVPITDSTAVEYNPGVDTLASGDLVVAYSSEYQGVVGTFFKVVDVQGNTVVPHTRVSTHLADGIDAAGLTGGGFVLAWFDEDDLALYYQIFNASGAPQGVPVTVTGVFVSGGWDHSHVQVVGTADGGFWLAHAAEGPNYSRRIRRFSSGGGEWGTPTERPGVEDTAWDRFAMTALPSGGALLVHDVPGLYDTEIIEAVFLDGDGTVAATHVLAQDYCYRADIAVAGDGRIFTFFELGGPDAAAYAVFDASGNVLVDTTVTTEQELSSGGVGAGVFGDGDFVGLWTDDESLVGVMHNITHDGVLVPPKDFWNAGPTLSGYSPPHLETLSDRELAVLYVPYGGFEPMQLQHITKGYLALETAGATEIVVTNYAAEPATVVLTAVGSEL